MCEKHKYFLKKNLLNGKLKLSSLIMKLYIIVHWMITVLQQILLIKQAHTEKNVEMKAIIDK